jgi:hypothetical protein
MPNVSKEGIMKTGKDARREGLYISECCNSKKVVHAGDMLPRCPKCLELTIWDLDEDVVDIKGKVA